MTAQTLEQRFAANLRAWRQPGSQAQLAKDMNDFGAETTREVIAKLETGKRESVTVRELVTAALALNVAPVDLLTGEPYTDELTVSPGAAPDRAVEIRRWFGGAHMLPSRWQRYVSEGRLTARSEFFRRAPTGLQLQAEFDDSPAGRALARLRDMVAGAWIRRPVEFPEDLAAQLLEQLEAVTAEVNELCQRLTEQES